jgi:hypothetical protein
MSDNRWTPEDSAGARRSMDEHPEQFFAGSAQARIAALEAENAALEAQLEHLKTEVAMQRNHLDGCWAERKRLEAENAALRELARAMAGFDPHAPHLYNVCPYCSRIGGEGHAKTCAYMAARALTADPQG